MDAPPPRWDRLPPLSQHLREFGSSRAAWFVLARNLIPVAGIYLFGWSAALAVFNYWIDGLTAFAAIIAAIMPRAMRETQPQFGGVAQRIQNVVAGVFVWGVLVAVLGLPYWIVLMPLHELLLSDELMHALRTSPSLWIAFGLMASSHVHKAFRAGYDAMPEKDLKQHLRWDVYLLILRAMAMFFMAAQGLSFILVPLMALLLTYFELWPARVLGAVFGDPSRLHEYDPETERKRSRRR